MTDLNLSEKIGLAVDTFLEAKKLDPVDKKALKKDFDDRDDKDIDNDGDVDDSDEYLHNRRKAVSKAVKKEDQKQFIYAAKKAKEAGEDEFEFAGEKYKVKEALDEVIKEALDEVNMGPFTRGAINGAMEKAGIKGPQAKAFINALRNSK